MKIGLLVIGNELLEGKIKDTNTQSFAHFLSARNLELTHSLTIGDSEDVILSSLKFLNQHCDVILTSGGLGPTKDDITKACLAKFYQLPVSYNEEAWNISLANYQRFNRPFTDKNHGYCFLPEGFLPLSNSTGFAPCFAYKENSKVLMSAPGVPREFMSFLQDHFEHLTKHLNPEKTFFDSLTFRTKKVPEEKIFTEIDPSLWDKLSQFGVVSSLPQVLGVDIGIRFNAKTQSELESKKQQVRNIIHSSPVSNIIWQEGRLALEELVVRVANEKNISYGFAESATGGLCSERITAVSGSSQTFMGSIICYSEQVKEEQLGVKRSSIETFGVVSQEVACEMAQGLREKLKVDIAISITGFAGPTGGTNSHPVGTACYGVSSRFGTKSFQFHYHGDRNVRRMRFSQECLFFLLEELAKFS